MAAIKGSEIANPEKGQAVWMIVSGRPALRYFVEFHSTGCRVAFAPDLKEIYYDEVAYFFKSEESILLKFIKGLVQRIALAAVELEQYRERLAELQNFDGELEAFRTRWRRWLGNKTRAGKPYWTTLLGSNWLSWVDKVFSDCGFDFHGISHRSTLPEVKAAYARAIDNATMEHLRKLDALYCEHGK